MENFGFKMIKEISNNELLEIYKKAEKHWSRPSWLCWILGWNNTNGGLSDYFKHKHSEYYNSIFFYPLWTVYSPLNCYGLRYFKNRKERLEAIRKVIKELNDGKSK